VRSLKFTRIIWLPAASLALSTGLVLGGCEDPSEVSEEELRVEALEESDGESSQADAQADELDRADPLEPSAGGWKKGGWKKDDDHGGWKKGGWKKDDDHGGWKKGGWKKDDDHGGWKHGGWKH